MCCPACHQLPSSSCPAPGSPTQTSWNERSSFLSARSWRGRTCRRARTLRRQGRKKGGRRNEHENSTLKHFPPTFASVQVCIIAISSGSHSSLQSGRRRRFQQTEEGKV
eukprot:761348-Hanusia_phi.AAC.2